MQNGTLSRLDQEILLRHRTGIILPPIATSEDLNDLRDGPPVSVPFGSKQFFDELGVDHALRKVITKALAKPPTREELRRMGYYSTAELKGFGLL